MYHALVTGAAGFIGSQLVAELLNREYSVTGFDNLATGRPARITPFQNEPNFTFVGGDLREKDDIEDTLADINIVFHQAAVPSVPRSVEKPLLTTKSNALGTTNLLVAARDAGVEKVVVASSSSVYGSGGELPKSETQPTNPESPYALSKYWTERLAVQFSDLYGLDTVALRYFNIFGPGQNPAGEYAAVIPKFIDRMQRGKRPVIYGDGEQSRDFTYVDNAVQANLKAAESTCTGEAMNVGNGGNTTINELVDVLNGALGMDVEPRYNEQRPGDVKHSYADISKAKELIGYNPEVDFEKGIEKTVTWMQPSR